MATSKTVDTKTIYEQLLAAKRTTAYALEKAAKLGSKTIASAMRRNTSVSYETAIRINAVYPDVSIEWLRTGKGEMLISSTQIQKTQAAERSADFCRQVPPEDFMIARVLVREARAAYLAARGGTEFVETLPTMLVSKEYENGSFLVIEVVGDSMDEGTHRAICDSDKILVKEVSREFWDLLPFRRHVFVISTKTEAPVVKQILNVNESEGMIVCHSWNSQFEDYSVRFEDIEKLSVVKKIVERQIRL